ncbi:MAG: hypothetical protein TREMPRED_003463, partial [Tremellales sp. Tagirdzhanova-0007]
PSNEFLLLALTLLDALPPSGPILDETMLQLQALFGPMLMSAFQLIDRREGQVSLPNARSLFQVTSSTGNPYTLYLDFPERPSPINTESEKTLPPIELRPDHTDDREDETSGVAMPIVERSHEAAELARRFAYNSLTGDRNVLCKHLLAVIIAHKLGKEVKTDVGLQGVMGLLGLGGSAET